ncbi:hypothetical protein FQR65_LT07167 [Abscondita terminalis]|nr:hypothetical protein FQR65_LT07167 [Abscondita terminalis]
MKNIHLLLLLNVCNTIAFNQVYKNKYFHQLQFCVTQVISQIFDESSTVVNSFIDHNMISSTINELSHIEVNMSNEIKGVYDKYATNYILQAKTMNMINFSIENILNGYLHNWHQSNKRRFIIITEEKNIPEIFNLMWQVFIIDLVVVYYDDTIEKFITYTSNPFFTENKCGDKANKIQKQECGSGTVIIFPEIIKNYDKCSFIYGVLDIEDFRNNISPLISSIKLTLREIRNILNITIHFKELVTGEHDYIKYQTRHYFTSSYVELSWDSMTNVFFYDDLLWFGTKAEKHLNTFFAPFSIKTWILIFTVFALILLIWWQGLLLQKVHAHKLQKFFESFSQITSLLFGVALPVIPKLNYIKFIILFYLLYIIHIQTAYTSDMINNLVVPQYEHNINNIQDLAKSDIPIFIHSEEHDNYFNEDVDNFDLYNKIFKKLIVIKDMDDIKNYSFKKFFLFLPKYMHKLKTLSKTQKITNQFVSNDISGSYKIAFMMMRGNYLVPSMNRVIAFLHEFGFYVHAYKYGDYFFKWSIIHQVVNYTFDISEIESWSHSLRLNDYKGVLIIFGSGWVFVVVMDAAPSSFVVQHYTTHPYVVKTYVNTQIKGLYDYPYIGYDSYGNFAYYP